MQHKTFDLLEVKTEGEAGEFSALASVFGNVDLVGDRMMPGAFSKTLEKWRESGDPIPVVLSHGHDDVMKFVGKADPRAVLETDEGLLVQGQLDIDSGNPVADQVYKLMRERLLKGWSFAYKVPKGGQKKAKDGANEVSEVDLIEVGPTLVGANPEAQLQAVKSLEAIGKSDEIDLEHPEQMAERLRVIADQLSPPEKSSPENDIEDVADEEPEKAKSQTQDSLSDHRAVFDVVTDGIDVVEPPKVKNEPPPEIPSLAELERQFHDLMLETLI